MVKVLGPIVAFSGGAALIFIKDSKIIKIKREKDEFVDTVTLTPIDKLRHELAAFIIALIILLLPHFTHQGVSWTDIFQAIIAFAGIWWLKYFYFKY